MGIRGRVYDALIMSKLSRETKTSFNDTTFSTRQREYLLLKVMVHIRKKFVSKAVFFEHLMQAVNTIVNTIFFASRQVPSIQSGHSIFLHMFRILIVSDRPEIIKFG